MLIRGAVHTNGRASQLRDYSGLLFSHAITPSDIDGVVDYKNSLWIFIELKLTGIEMPYGQRLMYQRLIDDLATTSKPSICFIAEHNTPIDKQIDAAISKVSEFRYRGQWHRPKNPINLKHAVNKFIYKHEELFK